MKDRHVLKFINNGRAVVCSCGKWKVVFTGQTMGQMSKLWERHKKEKP